MKKIIQPSEVCQYIKSGDTIYITGLTLGGFAQEAAEEIEKSFLETNSPKDLTIYFPSSIGNRKDTGLNHLSHEGLLKRIVGGHLLGCGERMGRLCQENLAEVYNWPQGVLSTMPREIAAQKPGSITKIGLGTMMDPRISGGKMNAKATEDLVELISINGEEWLLYKFPHIDVSLIRGTVADENGNVSLYKEGYILGQLAAAQAAKACGGIVICQVERIVKAGTLNPKDVRIPGIAIDYIYTSKPERHWQTAKTQYNPVFSGEVKIPLQNIPVEKLSARKIIARRAAMELEPGDIVNLGVGTPEAVASVAAEEGALSYITLTTEAGNIGGIPANENDFGCSWNPDSTLEMAEQFDLYDSGILDAGFLGLLQVGKNGNVNASMRSGVGIGIGGFMNIAAGARKVIFMATMTGGIRREDVPRFTIGGGKIHIDKEGNSKKFVNEIEQISCNAKMNIDIGKTVIYITERAVFHMTEDGLELIEIAPGVDLNKDVLEVMEFKPLISKNLREMPSGIFKEHWGELKDILDAKQKET